MTKPRALNTFLDGSAELGVDKHLIKNKKILRDLLEKEKVYRDQDKSDIEASDEETKIVILKMSRKQLLKRAMIWDMIILKTVIKVKSKILKQPQLAILKM